MTVQELIDELAGHDPDAEVYFEAGCFDNPCEILTASRVRLRTGEGRACFDVYVQRPGGFMPFEEAYDILLEG